jgi:hypothetical protein
MSPTIARKTVRWQREYKLAIIYCRILGRTNSIEPIVTKTNIKRAIIPNAGTSQNGA